MSLPDKALLRVAYTDYNEKSPHLVARQSEFTRFLLNPKDIKDIKDFCHRGAETQRIIHVFYVLSRDSLRSQRHPNLADCASP